MGALGERLPTVSLSLRRKGGLLLIWAPSVRRLDRRWFGEYDVHPGEFDGEHQFGGRPCDFSL